MTDKHTLEFAKEVERARDLADQLVDVIDDISSLKAQAIVVILSSILDPKLRRDLFSSQLPEAETSSAERDSDD